MNQRLVEIGLANLKDYNDFIQKPTTGWREQTRRLTDLLSEMKGIQSEALTHAEISIEFFEWFDRMTSGFIPSDLITEPAEAAKTQQDHSQKGLAAAAKSRLSSARWPPIPSKADGKVTGETNDGATGANPFEARPEAPAVSFSPTRPNPERPANDEYPLDNPGKIGDLPSQADNRTAPISDNHGSSEFSDRTKAKTAGAEPVKQEKMERPEEESGAFKALGGLHDLAGFLQNTAEEEKRALPKGGTDQYQAGTPEAREARPWSFKNNETQMKQAIPGKKAKEGTSASPPSIFEEPSIPEDSTEIMVEKLTRRLSREYYRFYGE